LRNGTGREKNEGVKKIILAVLLLTLPAVAVAAQKSSLVRPPVQTVLSDPCAGCA
jgi:hypothetical protein